MANLETKLAEVTVEIEEYVNYDSYLFQLFYNVTEERAIQLAKTHLKSKVTDGMNRVLQTLKITEETIHYHGKNYSRQELIDLLLQGIAVSIMTDANPNMHDYQDED